MNLQALAQQITLEVLERLQKANASPCVVVLDSRSAELSAIVQKEIGEQYDILFMNEDQGTQAIARHILPKLTCTAMADLAVGRASDEQTEAVLRLLLSGSAVEVLEFEYKRFTQTAPGPLYELYAAYEQTLRAYGLTELKRNKPERLRLSETLITAQTVLQAKEAGAVTLIVKQQAIVTPAAWETAKELNMRIEKNA